MQKNEAKEDVERSWFSNNFFLIIWCVSIFSYNFFSRSIDYFVFLGIAAVVCINLTYFYYKLTKPIDNRMLERGWLKTNLYFLISLSITFLIIKSITYLFTLMAFQIPESAISAFFVILMVGGLLYLIALALHFVEKSSKL